MPEPVSPGAALAALRRPHSITCPECGRQLTVVGRQKYCSPTHARTAAQRAWRQRQKEQAG